MNFGIGKLGDFEIYLNVKFPNFPITQFQNLP
jgi:hypothetical protein